MRHAFEARPKGEHLIRLTLPDVPLDGTWSAPLPTPEAFEPAGQWWLTYVKPYGDPDPMASSEPDAVTINGHAWVNRRTFRAANWKPRQYRLTCGAPEAPVLWSQLFEFNGRVFFLEERESTEPLAADD